MNGKLYTISKNEMEILYGEKIKLIVSSEDNKTVIEGNKIRTGSITTKSIAADTIVAEHISTDAIQTGHLSAASITTIKIAAEAITAEKIVANSILAKHIISDAIEARHIKADIIEGKHILADTITVDKLKANSILLPSTSYGGVMIDSNGLLMSNLSNDINLSAEKGLKMYNKKTGKNVFLANPTTGDIEMDVSSLTIKSSNVLSEKNIGTLGTRNYYHSESKITSLIGPVIIDTKSTDVKNGFKVTGHATNVGSFRINNVITETGWWTFTADAISNIPANLILDFCDVYDTVTYKLNTVKQKIKSTVYVNHVDSSYHFIDFNSITPNANYYFSNVKVEKGIIASDWTIADEDNLLINQKAIDNIEISTRNLLIKKNMEIGSINQAQVAGSTNEQTNSIAANRIRSKELIKIGGNLTISCSSEHMYSILIFNANKQYLGMTEGFVDWSNTTKTFSKIEYIKISIKKKSELNIILEDFDKMEVMVENSNKASKWMPSPEDTFGYVDEKEYSQKNYIKQKYMSSYISYNFTPYFLENILYTTIKSPNNGTSTMFTIKVDGFYPVGVYTMSGIMKVNGIPIKPDFFSNNRFTTYISLENIYKYQINTDGSFIMTGNFSAEYNWLFHTVIKSEYITHGDVISIENFQLEKGSNKSLWSLSYEDYIESISIKGSNKNLLLKTDSNTDIMTRAEVGFSFESVPEYTSKTGKYAKYKVTSLATNSNRGLYLANVFGENKEIGLIPLGQKIVFSFIARGSKNMKLNCYMNGFNLLPNLYPNFNRPQLYELTTSWKKYYFVLESTTNVQDNILVAFNNHANSTAWAIGDEFHIHSMQVEYGTVSTEYNQSPLDIPSKDEVTTQLKIETDRIDLSVSTVSTNLTKTDWKTKAATGKVVFNDSQFKNGNNNIVVYNNAGGGTVNMYREEYTAASTNPSGTTRYRFVHTGPANPGLGGFIFSTITGRANGKFLEIFTANIPVGRYLTPAANAIGDGSKFTWLTSNQGTGTWFEYVLLIECGATGAFATFSHIYLNGGSTPTAAAPLTWYLDTATVVDITADRDVMSTNETVSAITVAKTEIELGVNTSIKNIVTGTGNQIFNSSGDNEDPYLLIANIPYGNVSNATLSYIADGWTRMTSANNTSQHLYDIGTATGAAFASPGLEKYTFENLQVGDTVMFSGEINNVSAGNSTLVIYIGTGNAVWTANHSEIIPNGTKKRATVSAKIPANCTGILFRILASTVANGVLDYRKLMATKGTHQADWEPNIRDNIKNSSNENILTNTNFQEQYSIGGAGTDKHPDNYAVGWGGFNSGIPNPTTSWHAHVDNERFGFPVCVFNESEGTRNWKGIAPKISPMELSPFKNGGKIWISMDLYTQGTAIGDTRIWGGCHYINKAGVQSFHNGFYEIFPSIIGEWERLYTRVPFNYDNADLTKDMNFYFYGYNWNQNNIVYIKNVKLEVGKYATEYEVSQKDIVKVSEMTDVRLRLEPESISQTVTSSEHFSGWTQETMSQKADKDLFDQAKKDLDELGVVINDDAEGIVTKVGKLETRAGSIEMTVENTLTTVTDQGTTISSIRDYMTFDDKGLTIAKSNSPFKVNLSNQKLSFLDGTVEVAYVNNQKMYIKEAEILDTIIIGSHSISKDSSTGKTVIRWIK